jgi:hypothetical protein
MATALTCKIEAAGSWWLGGTMVMVFYVFFGCMLCVVVWASGGWFLGVCHVMCMCPIRIFTAPYFFILWY